MYEEHKKKISKISFLISKKLKLRLCYSSWLLWFELLRWLSLRRWHHFLGWPSGWFKRFSNWAPSSPDLHYRGFCKESTKTWYNSQALQFLPICWMWKNLHWSSRSWAFYHWQLPWLRWITHCFKTSLCASFWWRSTPWLRKLQTNNLWLIQCKLKNHVSNYRANQP